MASDLALGLVIGAFAGIVIGALGMLACVWNQLDRTDGDATGTP